MGEETSWYYYYYYYYYFIITKELIIVTQSQLYNCYWGTVQTHCHWSGKDCRKSVCLSFCRNIASDGAALMEDGRAFHVRAADTGNALSPSVEQRIAGTISFMDSAERRRRRAIRACTSPTSCSDSARYAGAVLCRPRQTSMLSRNWIVSGTLSQCSSRSNSGC